MEFVANEAWKWNIHGLQTACKQAPLDFIPGINFQCVVDSWNQVKNVCTSAICTLFCHNGAIRAKIQSAGFANLITCNLTCNWSRFFLNKLWWNLAKTLLICPLFQKAWTVWWYWQFSCSHWPITPVDVHRLSALCFLLRFRRQKACFMRSAHPLETKLTSSTLAAAATCGRISEMSASFLQSGPFKGRLLMVYGMPSSSQSAQWERERRTSAREV